MDRADEQRHRPSADPLWTETIALAFWAEDGSLAGHVAMTLVPGASPTPGTIWFSAALLGRGRPLVSVVDHDVPLPAAGLEVRSSGLWVDVIVQTPLEHATVGLEAFGVALDDPEDALDKGWGDRTPLGFDLEWESEAAAVTRRWETATEWGYEIVTSSHGEILVGSEALELDGFGYRYHHWGDQPWWRSSRLLGVGADGSLEHRLTAPERVVGPDGALAIVRRGLPAVGRGWLEVVEPELLGDR